MIASLLIAAVPTAAEIPAWLLAPFAGLLLLIAAMPLTPPRIKHFWEKAYPFVSLALGGLVAAYYFLNVPAGGAVIAHTLHEYFSFIALIGSLFVISGGIHIKVPGGATPIANVAFLAFGAVIANVIGTTGASMVLIRPWIRMNQIRIGAFHVVFFIFVVSNIGGALTPIGDPPLFLGYLRGVPFFWLVERVLMPWLATLGALLLAFYFFDRRSFRQLPHQAQGERTGLTGAWQLDGAGNLLLLLVAVGAVFLPARFFLREIALIGAAAISFFTTNKTVHTENAFTFEPIKEVAWLFIGIFLTMMPALGYLAAHGPELGVARPLHYYFATGGLSAVLDNAPTYVSFLQLAEATARELSPAAFAAAGNDPVQAVRVLLVTQPGFVIAISLGAVFFGAMTYIGNGPNFMVKSIAQDSGVPCPTFFGFLFKYSLPILLPILVLVGLLFL
jgi:Na+/H+ antiporter NhaD/arsenite permease-like protein